MGRPVIWIKGFPMPPSVNECLMPVGGELGINKRTGRAYRKGHMVKTAVARHFTEHCLWWAKANATHWNRIRDHLHQAKLETERNGQPFALRVDAYAVFPHDRLFTVNRKVELLDANNRLKPLLDGLALILGIDDKHFFAGNCEKIYTLEGNQECTILRLSTMRPRSLLDIQELITQELKTNTPASSSCSSAKATTSP